MEVYLLQFSGVGVISKLTIYCFGQIDANRSKQHGHLCIRGQIERPGVSMMQRNSMNRGLRGVR